MAAGIDAVKIADGSVSNAELQYINSLTSNVQTQLDNKANLASPALTGSPTAPTQAVSDNSTKIATTAFVKAASSASTGSLSSSKTYLRTNNSLGNLMDAGGGLELEFNSNVWSASNVLVARTTSGSFLSTILVTRSITGIIAGSVDNPNITTSWIVLHSTNTAFTNTYQVHEIKIMDRTSAKEWHVTVTGDGSSNAHITIRYFDGANN